MERPTCKTCIYWKQHPETELYGECRRGPAKDSRNMETRNVSGVLKLVRGTWFDQREDEWCGAHPNFPAYIASLKPAESSGNSVLDKLMKTVEKY